MAFSLYIHPKWYTLPINVPISNYELFCFVLANSIGFIITIISFILLRKLFDEEFFFTHFYIEDLSMEEN
jgi:hypothetical protein